MNIIIIALVKNIYMMTCTDQYYIIAHAQVSATFLRFSNAIDSR